MKKCLGVIAVLLLVSGVVQAATTITNTVGSGYKFDTLVWGDSLNPYGGSNTWTYAHTGIFPADGTWNETGVFPETLETITSATLTIRANSVNIGDVITITADATTLGTLQTNANGDWTTTTFNLDPALFTTDGALNMGVKIGNFGQGKNVLLDYSTVTVVFDEVATEEQPPEPPEPPTPTVPAPGAVVLGALGLGLVSWLRSRKAL